MLCSDFSVSGRNFLFLIDPQIDFHDGGNLGIPGSTKDAQLTAKFIRDNIDKIDEVFVTLDSHNRMHIAHGAFWSSTPDGKGTEPSPFTLMKHNPSDPEDITLYTFDGGNIDMSKPWYPKNKTHAKWGSEYSRKLCEGGFALCIWPEHCLIGTNGHCVQADINAAIQDWSKVHSDKVVKYIPKGMNNMTEMYSGIRAEVPVSADTKSNHQLLDALSKCERLYVAGQAQSHCVNYTVRDLVINWYGDLDAIRAGSAPQSSRHHSEEKSGNAPLPSNIYILEDQMSSVPGFDEAGETFLLDMKRHGLSVIKTAEAELF